MAKTYQKAAALLLALALIFVFPVSASAAETTEAKVPVTLTVVNTVAPISCTVPACLPVSLVDGYVVTANNAAITNTAKTGSSPYDWFWGRYEKPTIDQFDDETQIAKLDNEQFETMSVEDFLATPGAAVYQETDADGKTKTYEGLAPIFGEPLDDFLFEDGFRQWTSDEIEKAE